MLCQICIKVSAAARNALHDLKTDYYPDFAQTTDFEDGVSALGCVKQST